MPRLDNFIPAPPSAIRDFIAYNPETGVFTRLVTSGRNAIAGQVAGAIDSKGYAVIEFRGGRYKAHRLAWFYVHGVMPAELIDHIDGNPGNNAIANLREASVSQNNRNTKRKTTNLRGARLIPKSGRYAARIKVLGAYINLGTFDTEAEAHQAYMDAAATHDLARFVRAS